MIRTLALACSLALGGCAYVPPDALPTAPSAVTPTASRAAATFRIEAVRRADSVGAIVTIQAWSEDGRLAEIDATCSTTAGVFDNPRARGQAPAILFVRGATVPAVVTCQTTTGLVATAAVDMSAWRLSIGTVTESLVSYTLPSATSNPLRSETRILMYADALIQGYPLRSRSVDWGDGTVEQWNGSGDWSSTQTLIHHYRSPGTYTVVNRVTWDGGGAITFPIEITRTCDRFSDDRAILFPDGLCFTTWRKP